MTSIRRHKWASYVSAMLVVTFMATLLPATALAEMIEKPARVLVFPVTDSAETGLASIERTASGILQLAVDGVPGMEATDFNVTSSIVRRALSEGRLLPAQIEGQITDPLQALRIGRALGMDKVLLAEIEALRKIGDPATSVEVVVSGTLYDVAANTDLEAGRVISANPERPFAVIGVSSSRVDYRGAVRPMAREALDDAAAKIAMILEGKSPAETEAAAQPAPRVKDSRRNIAYLVGLGLLIGLIATSGGSDGPSRAAAAPTPLRVEVQPNAVRLFWSTPTGTNLTLLGYQIERSTNGAPWQRIADFGDADASLTQWPDFDVLSGNTYQYRIRAVYTNSAFSEWRLFTAVLFN